MTSYGWVPGTGVLARYLVVDNLQWLSLTSMMVRTLANPPPRGVAAVAPRRSEIQQNDRVRTQRDLVVGTHRIARGSVGTVVALHRRRPLVEVAFFLEHPVSVTIAGYDLLALSA